MSLIIHDEYSGQGLFENMLDGSVWRLSAQTVEAEVEAFMAALPGPPGLSPATVSRLQEVWKGELEAWQRRI